MACLLLVIVAALIVLERYGRRRRAFTALGTDGRHASRITLAGRARWVATGVCVLPVLLGFLLPAGYLLHEVVGRGLLSGFDSNLVRYTLTTVTLASAATSITLVIGFLAVAGLRYTKHPAIAGCVNTAGIGYAVPGTVLALGLLSPLVLMDGRLSHSSHGTIRKERGWLTSHASLGTIRSSVPFAQKWKTLPGRADMGSVLRMSTERA